MKRLSWVFAAALLAAGGLFAWSQNRGIAEEQSKPTAEKAVAADNKVTASKSRLRTGKQAIETGLGEKVDFQFDELPLSEAVRRIRLKHHLEIQFDINALKDAAIDPTAIPVSLGVKDIALRSALKLMLGQQNLTYVIKDDVLQITTKDKANTTLETHVYDVRDVLPSGDKNDVDFDSLIDLITSTLAAQTWSEVGGPGTIEGFGRATLVVSQTGEAQEEIVELFNAIRRTAAQMKAGKFDVQTPYDLLPSEKAIVKSLGEKVDLAFEETPLKEVANEIQKQSHIQIEFDVNALKDAAIDPTAIPVSYSASGIALRSALNGILDQQNLTYIIKHEVLQITTKDKANTTLVTMLYPVEDLMDRKTGETDSDVKTAAGADELIDTITATVAPQTWSEVGGPGNIKGYYKDGMILVIPQTREVHEEIADLLGQLREVHQKQKDEVAKEEDKPKEPETMVLRVYDLRASAPNAPAMTPQEVMEVVKGLVEPKSWGQGDAYIRGATGKLIVRQVPSVQREVEKLLHEIGAQVPVVGKGQGGPFTAGMGRGGARARKGKADQPNGAVGVVPGGGGGGF